MAKIIRIKRSAVPGKAPAITDLELGELAINTHEGRLYLKKFDGTTESIVDVTVGAGYTGSQGVIGYTGSIGLTGSVGFVGSQGFTGSQGIAGPTGFTGSQGIAGPTGFTGSQGIAGPTGFTGSRGFVGSKGFTGSQGQVGPTGYTGSLGPRGFTGSQGIQGYTGSVGPQGNLGFTGSRGFVGSRGVTGFTGSLGYTGSKGEVGFTGSRGFVGSAGYTGSRGVIGYTGSVGLVGFESKEAMDLNLQHPDETIAFVTNDPNPANNAVYRKVGAPNSGSWVISSFDRITALEQNLGQGSYVVGDLLYATDDKTLTRLPKGSGNQLLQMNASGTLPEWTTDIVVGEEIVVYGHKISRERIGDTNDWEFRHKDNDTAHANMKIAQGSNLILATQSVQGNGLQVWSEFTGATSPTVVVVGAPNQTGHLLDFYNSVVEGEINERLAYVTAQGRIAGRWLSAVMPSTPAHTHALEVIDGGDFRIAGITSAGVIQGQGLQVVGNGLFTGTLTVNSTATVGETLAVTGTSTLTGNVGLGTAPDATYKLNVLGSSAGRAAKFYTAITSGSNDVATVLIDTSSVAANITASYALQITGRVINSYVSSSGRWSIGAAPSGVDAFRVTGGATIDNLTLTGVLSVTGGTTVGIHVSSSNLTGANQYGIDSRPTTSSAATATGIGVIARANTAAAVYTQGLNTAFYAANPSKGVGSTITKAVGVYVEAINAGSTNYAIETVGVTPSVFGGPVGIGTAPASGAMLHVEGAGGGIVRLARTTATTTGEVLGEVNFFNGSNRTVLIRGLGTAGATDAGQIDFWTKATGQPLTRRLEINASGLVSVTNDLSVGGRATVDTFKVGGGSNNPSTSVAAVIGPSTLSATNQTALLVNPQLLSSATANVRGIDVLVGSLSTSFTTTSVFNVFIRNPVKAVGHTITNNYGLYLEDQTAGTNNYAVWVNGTAASYFGGPIGMGIAPGGNVGLYVRPNSVLTGPSQFGIYSDPVFNSTATSSAFALRIRANTSAESFNLSTMYGMFVDTPTKGTGSSVTNVYGLYINDQTGGSVNNYAIYSSGTAPSYFGGIVTASAGLISQAAVTVARSGTGPDIVINKDTGWSSINAATLRLRSTTNNTTTGWEASPWAQIDFYSDDTSGAGVGVRARIGARMAHTNGSMTDLVFSTAPESGSGLAAALILDHNGNISVPRGTLTVSGKTIVAEELTVYGHRLVRETAGDLNDFDFWHKDNATANPNMRISQGSNLILSTQSILGNALQVWSQYDGASSPTVVVVGAPTQTGKLIDFYDSTTAGTANENIAFVSAQGNVSGRWLSARLPSAPAHTHAIEVIDVPSDTRIFGVTTSGIIQTMGLVVVGNGGMTGTLGVGTVTPNAAAALDVTSTTKGFLPPRMTTAQRDAISSPPDGLVIFNTDTTSLELCLAGLWNKLAVI